MSGSVESVMPGVTAQDSLQSRRTIHDGRTVLNMSNVSFSVPVKSWGRTVGEKHILSNVSMTMHSGEALAIMGPSGAGKTTFMDVLTLQAAGGTGTGCVDLNYEPLTPQVLRKYCAYVPQNDNAWPFLTCRESIQFAADFFVAGGSQVKKDRVDRLVKSMGLESCQHNKVGNEFMKGLSGGQRRRLSLATAFLKDPLVIFLDEVTSGLDAAAAASIASFLQELASTQDVIIACTIHQPSAKIFQGFKQFLLLSGGRVAYSGKTCDAPEYFASLGLSIPKRENPADFFLDSVNGDFTEQSRVNRILDSWEGQPVQRMSGSFAVNPLEQKQTQNLCTQFRVMLRRMMLLALRDPVVYTSRMVVFTVACIFFALVYVKSRARQQDQAFNRVWLILWCMGVPNMMSLAACLGQNLEFVSIKREVKAGMYSLAAYLGAQFVIQIPLLFVLSAIAIGPSGFGIGNWNGNAYLQMWLIHCLAMHTFEFAAQFFAVLFAHPLLGLFQVICFWFASFLFAGFLVPVDDTPWPVKVFSYISPLQYAVRSMVWNEMQGTKWEGAVLDNSTEGYSCPDHSYHECFGVTGDQVLESMQRIQFKSLSQEDQTLQDCLILLAIAGTFKLLYVGMAAIQCRNINAVQPAAAVKKAAVEKASADDITKVDAGAAYAMP